MSIRESVLGPGPSHHDRQNKNHDHQKDYDYKTRKPGCDLKARLEGKIFLVGFKLKRNRAIALR